MQSFLQSWGYLAIFAATLISSMCIPIGSEVAIAYGGVLASGQVAAHTGHDHLSLALVIVVATVGELIGSSLGYGIGYFGGRPLVNRVGKFVLLTHQDLDRAEEWFNHRGEWSVLIARFIPLVRSFISVAAGLGEMALGKFAVFTVIGCAAWCAALASIGYSLGSSYEHVIKAFSYAGYVAIVLVVLAVVALILHRLRVVRAERAGLEPRRRGAHSRR
ncbi:MAG TPA: DedA family protein [Acidimicrobiales bacterium]|jgi:membrane protein DedA with SNARE-associated domain|nr:DedA family protein [Acidimicrobiales bacterium]